MTEAVNFPVIFCSGCGEKLGNGHRVDEFIEDEIDWFACICAKCCTTMFVAVPKNGKESFRGTVIGLFNGVHKIRQFNVVFSEMTHSD
jgi:hypothetical protein